MEMHSEAVFVDVEGASMECHDQGLAFLLDDVPLVDPNQLSELPCDDDFNAFLNEILLADSPIDPASNDEGAVFDVQDKIPLDGCSSSTVPLPCGEEEKSDGDVMDSVEGKASGETQPDPDEHKRQVRLFRNRVSASESRQRKKSYMKDLESKCRMLESRCTQLQQAVTFVNSENAVLRSELSRVRLFKGNSKGGVAEPAVLVKDSLPSEFLPLRSQLCPWSDITVLCILHLLLMLVPLFTSAASGRSLQLLLPMLLLPASMASNHVSGPDDAFRTSSGRSGWWLPWTKPSLLGSLFRVRPP